MKTVFNRLLFPILCICNLSAIAQTKFVGSWEGTIDVGAQLRLVFNITDNKGHLSGTMDSPDQKAVGIPCSKVTVRKDSLFVEIANIGGQYKGKRKDSVTIKGNWIQNGSKFPLELKRGTTTMIRNRPQEPKPPYPYNSEDVIYYNSDPSIQFGATITIPKDTLRHPSLLLITGSGQENRDEELFGHKPFAVIADYLTRRGYVVLRVDDRGVGQTTGDVEHATSEDFAKDVTAGIDYLRTRPEVDTLHMGLLGHSEGGMIAPMVAGIRNDIQFIVLMAAPGVPITQLMEEQGSAVLKSMGTGTEAINKYVTLYRALLKAVITAKDSADLRNNISDTVIHWIMVTPADIVMGTTGIHDDASREHFIDMFTSLYRNTWYRYFLAYDPQPYLKKLSCKVLALNGDKDIQVISKSNLEGIRQSLSQSKSKDYEIQELPGLNHLFQSCLNCTVMEYGELTETINPDVLKAIGEWLDKNVK